MAGWDAAGGAGELTAPERFRVETERHRIFLEHAQGLAMEDYHRSCATIDRSAEEDRLWKLGQHRFDEIQAEMRREW